MRNRRSKPSTGSSRNSPWISPTWKAQRTYDYLRYGTTTLFAALDIATGKGIAKCKARHRCQEFLAFLRLIDKDVPAHLDIDLELDNYATHKHNAVKRWLAERSRYHPHFTPTFLSWLNQLERWFGLLSEKVLEPAGVVAYASPWTRSGRSRRATMRSRSRSCGLFQPNLHPRERECPPTRASDIGH